MDRALRRQRLGAWLAEEGLDALLVTRLPNVRYLTGFTGSNGQLAVGRERSLFLTDGRYAEQARREVPDLGRVVCPDGFVGRLPEVLGELRARRVGFEEAGVTYATYVELTGAAGAELVPVQGPVERLRWVKDEEEIRAIERAQGFTDAAFDHVLGVLRAGLTEREVALELEVAMRGDGADGAAFEPIVAFGDHAAEPHHRPTDRPLGLGDVVKLDFGAVADGYHADMTRTVALGEPSGELRALHALVARAQRAGIESLRAGAKAAEVDLAARSVIEEAGLGERFPHGLGHGVGLEIHEGPMLRWSSTHEIPAGAVVTVEPGVYVPGLGGVRIEDMVLVDGDHARLLARSTRDLVVL